MRDPADQIAVIDEEEETRGISIQSSNGYDVLRNLDEIEHRLTSVFIGGRRDVTHRFVQHDVSPRLRAEQLSVDTDFLALWIDLAPEFAHDDAIDGHPTRQNQLFGFPPRCDTVRGKNTLQSLLGHRHIHSPLHTQERHDEEVARSDP